MTKAAAHPHSHSHSRPGSSSSLVVSKKHFQKDGKWIVKPSATVVLVCACGNKYISTRPNQTTCIKCIVAVV
jgi:hypothetical protein